MKNILSVIAVATVLCACSTYDPYTGEKEASKTAIAASIGASVGAIIA